MNNNLSILKDIQEVEAPDFLFTRIKQEIESKQYNVFTFSTTFSIGICLLVILILNVSFIFKYYEILPKLNNNEYTMNLMSNNSLYNE